MVRRKLHLPVVIHRHDDGDDDVIHDDRRQELKILYRGTLVWQPLNRVPPSNNVHQRHTRNFPYPSAEFPVARRDDEAPVGSDALNEAVVRVRAGMRTREAFKARIARNSVSRCGRRQKFK